MSAEPPNNSLPAGLELFYDVEKGNVKTPLQAFVLALHWAVMRAGLRIKKPTPTGSTTVETTEKLPEGWTSHIDHISTVPASLDYVNQSDRTQSYQLKVIEVAPNDTVVVTVFTPQPRTPTDSSTGTPRTSSASTFQIASYIRMPEGTEAAQTTASPHNIYYNASEMETKIWSELLEPLGLRVMGQPPIPGPYEDKTKRENAQSQSQSEDRRYPGSMPYYGGGPMPGLPTGGIGGPLYVPPVGGGGLGRSDLDPLGGAGAGMIADPRGFRNPRFGQPGGMPGIPPGARFDPFGPPHPGAGPRPGGPGGPTGPNWAVPNPDHEQPPPGFDDMFM